MENQDSLGDGLGHLRPDTNHSLRAKIATFTQALALTVSFSGCASEAPAPTVTPAATTKEELSTPEGKRNTLMVEKFLEDFCDPNDPIITPFGSIKSTGVIEIEGGKIFYQTSDGRYWTTEVNILADKQFYNEPIEWGQEN